MADNFLRRLKTISIVNSLDNRLNGLEDSLEAVPCLLSELLRCLDQFLKLNVDLAVCFEAIFSDTSLNNLVTNFKHAQESVITSISHFVDVHSCKPLEKISKNIEEVKACKETFTSCLEAYKESQKSFDDMCRDRRYSTKKLENAQQTLAASGEHCSRQDMQMAEALEDLSRTTVEVAGPVFFTLVEGQTRMVQHLSAVLLPFRASSEAGMLLTIPPNHPALTEAVSQWLSVHHAPQNLLAIEGLNRTDLQALVRCKQDGLASQLKIQLNSKVDQLLQNYLRELRSSSALSYNLLGGFHYKPSVIQSILKDCCTDAEAKAAGAPLPLTEQEHDAQIIQDIPYMVLSIASQQFRAATSSRDNMENIKEKQLAIFNIISESASDGVHMDMVELFTHRVLLELCGSVTLTASRTAVQLVFGKANLIAVWPSQNPEDVAPVEIIPIGNGGIKIVTCSTWWLVEDYTTLVPLRTAPKMPIPLGAVDVTYTQELSLDNFIKHSGLLELPEINITYRPASSPIDYPPAMAAAEAKQHRRSWTKVDDIRGLSISDDIDNKSDCSNKTGSTVMSRRKHDKISSKSSFSAMPVGDSNLPYTRSIGGSSGSISSATTLTGKHRPETDDPYQFSFISTSSRTSYLNPLRLQEHTQLESQKAVQGGGWKSHRHKHDDDGTAKGPRDSPGQLPFMIGMDHSSSEDLADQEGYTRSRRFSDQGWSTGSSQEVNHSLSNSSLNEGDPPQIPQTRGGTFHTDHKLLDSRPIMRSRPSSKKKPGESGISIDSGITSSDNSQENDIPTSTYIPGLETKPENGNASINSRSRISNSFVPPTSQYGGYYGSRSYDPLSTPNPDSSSDEQDEEMLGIRLKLTEEKWDNILNSDRDNVPTFSRVGKATSSENLGLDVTKPRGYDPWGSTQSLDAMEMREARHARMNPIDGRISEPFIQHSLSQDAPCNHPRQLSDAGNYMFNSQESLEGYPMDDQGLPPRSSGGFDQFGPPVRNFHMGPGRPSRHKEFSPSPSIPLEPGLSPQKMPFHGGPPPNHWQQNPMAMMNHGLPPNRPPPPWEPSGFRPIPPHPGYENPSPGPSPGPSPRPTPPPTPPPPNHPNHMMMGGHPPPPISHHQRPHSAPMNHRIPMGMPPPRQPVPPFWDQGNPPPMGPPRGGPAGPFMGHPPPPPHGRFVPPGFQHEWEDWSQR